MQGRIVFLLAVLLFATQRVEAFIAINEILADPATDLTGDANQDGIRDGNDDEFVELINFGATSVDISGWYISDAVSARHIFSANTFLDPYAYLVVFGGGTPQLPEVNTLTASSGLLGLNNTGDTVSLFDLNDQLITQVIYGPLAGHDEAIVRSPEVSGVFVLHSTVQEGLFSPGSGGIRPPLANTVVPEPASILTFALGSLAILRRKP